MFLNPYNASIGLMQGDLSSGPLAPEKVDIKVAPDDVRKEGVLRERVGLEILGLYHDSGKSVQYSVVGERSEDKVEVRVKKSGDLVLSQSFFLAGGGWMPDLPRYISEAWGVLTAKSLYVDQQCTLMNFMLGAWSSYLATSILTTKMNRCSQNHHENANQSGVERFQGGAKVGQGEECCDCCVAHDMQCTDAPDVFMMSILEKFCGVVEIDIQECCQAHDINMWCGPQDKTVDFAERPTYALEVSSELAACILDKFLRGAMEFPWYCGGTLVALPFALVMGTIVSASYFLVTLAVHLFGVVPLSWTDDYEWRAALCRLSNSTGEQ